MVKATSTLLLFSSLMQSNVGSASLNFDDFLFNNHAGRFVIPRMLEWWIDFDSFIFIHYFNSFDSHTPYLLCRSCFSVQMVHGGLFESLGTVLAIQRTVGCPFLVQAYQQ
jgi:hypothetical protein